MYQPIALLIVVCVIALALALGVIGDLRHAWRFIRAGGLTERRQARGGYEAHAQAHGSPKRQAARREDYGWDGKQGFHANRTSSRWGIDRPLHRNFGVPPRGADIGTAYDRLD